MGDINSIWLYEEDFTHAQINQIASILSEHSAVKEFTLEFQGNYDELKFNRLEPSI